MIWEDHVEMVRIKEVNIGLTEDMYRKAIEYAEVSHFSPANWMRYKVFTEKFPPMKSFSFKC